MLHNLQTPARTGIIMSEPTTVARDSVLTGVYTITGYTGRSLRRADGVSLSINDSRRPGNAARYVRVTTGGRPTYCGNLYGPDGRDDAAATANLDGCEFQHNATKIRYVISATGEAGEYAVTPKGGAST